MGSPRDRSRGAPELGWRGAGRRKRVCRGGALGSEKRGQEGAAARAEGMRGRGGLASKPSSLFGGKPPGAAGKTDLERVTLCGTNAGAGVELSRVLPSHPTSLHPTLFPQLPFLTCGSFLGWSRGRWGVRSPRWTSS